MNPKEIWIVSEGSPGHVSQSHGLVKSMGELVESNTTIIETRQKFGGLMRLYYRLWLSLSGRAFSKKFLKERLFCDVPSGRCPDLIVSSGGKSVFAAKSLAMHYSTDFVFLGERKPYPSNWFDIVLTPSPFETDVNDVAIEIIPTEMSAEMANSAADNWEEKPDGVLFGLC